MKPQISLKAVCAIALPPPQGGAAPQWIHVFPAGYTTGRDGRGPYALEDAEGVVAASMASATQRGIPMDYDHQLEYSERNGQPAPASGWITELAARADGIWGRVEWTEKAAAHVAAHEYRFVSPVFYHQGGRVTLIESVALTNTPNLAVKALSAKTAVPHQEEIPMNKVIAAMLGLSQDAAESVVTDAVRLLQQERDGLRAALADVGTAACCTVAVPGEVVKAVASLKAAAEKPDPSKFIGLDVYNAVSKELASLKAEKVAAAAKDLVDAAYAEGKILPAQKEWATNYAASDLEGFKTWVSLAPDLRPGRGKSSAATAAPPSASGDTLTDVEKSVCKSCGLDEESFKKAKEKRSS